MKYLEMLRENTLPMVGTFCLKVILAIVIYLICSRVIKWLCTILRKSMTKAGVPAEFVTF